MTRMVMIGRSVLVASAIAAMAACGNGNNARSNQAQNPNAAKSPAADQSAASQKEPEKTVTGCLQKGKTGTFILTRLNEPSQKEVATSGTPGAVEREQAREAENAYRIDAPENVKLDDMVGKKISVTGTLTDRGDVAKEAAEAAGTSGQKAQKNEKGLDIGQSDLAKIQASSVTVVADVCNGGAKAPASSKTKKRPRN